MHKKTVSAHPSKVDETINRSNGTLVASKNEVDLLGSQSARPFNFCPGNKQQPGWMIANDDQKTALKNTRPSEINVLKVGKVMPLT